VQCGNQLGVFKNVMAVKYLSKKAKLQSQKNVLFRESLENCHVFLYVKSKSIGCLKAAHIKALRGIAQSHPLNVILIMSS
jgi:hypothetical protein